MIHNDIAIEFKKVCYEVNDLSILNNVSGVFYNGKITTLVGPSGAGKTSLLKMCNGLHSPTSGDIYIFNKPITTYEPTALRTNVGIVLQSSPIIRGTVFENLALPFKLQNKTLLEKEAIAFLEDVGLDRTFLYRQGRDLSGGQQQKVSIARTLMNQPNILLLDEITSALDPTSVQEIEQLLLNINKKYKTTIIWITHNIEQAKRIGDYTWMMMEGQLVESGESKRLWSTSNDFIQTITLGGQEV
ncbi:ATP-binding cassette domain-containing protein [Lysinibacillus sp. BW-2-10]|uniref:ABC transporter ATP-binding protein n=1 Tax=Lysinibacillus sp. BW-2-10 TaxID=2590030 RepID=UPI00117C4CED|nr:phosphate ABC transporter ATP-binding protein [Lysinibacillus sp. BW-2-10]TSI04481.1 phosphate ABC transporter ATP-binding protein [Lysinibacillus sp. BW-2-10]